MVLSRQSERTNPGSGSLIQTEVECPPDSLMVLSRQSERTNPGSGSLIWTEVECPPDSLRSPGLPQVVYSQQGCTDEGSAAMAKVSGVQQVVHSRQPDTAEASAVMASATGYASEVLGMGPHHLVDVPTVAAMSAKFDRPSRTSAEVSRLCSSEVGLGGSVSSSSSAIQATSVPRRGFRAALQSFSLSNCALEVRCDPVRSSGLDSAGDCSPLEPRALDSVFGQAGGRSIQEPRALQARAGGSSFMEPRASQGKLLTPVLDFRAEECVKSVASQGELDDTCSFRPREGVKVGGAQFVASPPAPEVGSVPTPTFAPRARSREAPRQKVVKFQHVNVSPGFGSRNEGMTDVPVVKACEGQFGRSVSVPCPGESSGVPSGKADVVAEDEGVEKLPPVVCIPEKAPGQGAVSANEPQEPLVLLAQDTSDEGGPEESQAILPWWSRSPAEVAIWGTIAAHAQAALDTWDMFRPRLEELNMPQEILAFARAGHYRRRHGSYHNGSYDSLQAGNWTLSLVAVCLCSELLETFGASDTLGCFLECFIDALDDQGLAGYEKVMLISTLIKSTLPLMQLAGQTYYQLDWRMGYPAFHQVLCACTWCLTKVLFQRTNQSGRYLRRLSPSVKTPAQNRPQTKLQMLTRLVGNVQRKGSQRRRFSGWLRRPFPENRASPFVTAEHANSDETADFSMSERWHGERTLRIRPIRTLPNGVILILLVGLV